MNMYDNRKDLLRMVQKYLQGNATPEEISFLESYYDFFDRQEDIIAQLQAEEKQLLSEQLESGIWEKIDKAEIKKIKPLWPRIAAAASILIAVSVGGYFILQQKTVKNEFVKQDIVPGKNRATLTLANGKKIILTKSLNGLLAQQGSTSIQIDAKTGISYKGTGNQTLQYNTLATARGEISPLPLVLSDGSKVWVNTASSITYPVTFAGNERKVIVTGEAYFEVVHNAAKPFIVSTANETIRDIGTSFDVNAYTDEPISRTTLVEGSVSVNGTVLKPGQQSRLIASNITVANADIQEIIAWKTGMFHFTDEKLAEIMLQVSRWYDVDVVYDNETLKNKTFGVIGNRFANVSKLLHSLEITGEVKFKVEGKKITVYNK